MSATALPLPASTHVPNSFACGLRVMISETRFELLRLTRTRAFSVSVIGFPVMFYTLFGLLLNRGEHMGGITVSSYLLGGYAVFGTVGAAMFGVGVSLASDFAAGWMELKRASPMPPLAYLLGKCATAIVFGLVIASLLCAMGIAFGHVHLTLPVYLRILLLTVGGAVPFAALSLLIALLVPFNSAPGVTNLLSLPMSFLGGLWLPVRALPLTLQKFAPMLPTYHVGQLMFRALGYPASGTALEHTLYLVSFTVLALGIAAALFHRRENNG